MMTRLRRFCIVLICLLFLAGCAPDPKGGDVLYGTITGKRIGEYFWPTRQVYEVNVKVDDGTTIEYGEVDEATYHQITFGSRVKLTYTGFGTEWAITAVEP